MPLAAKKRKSIMVDNIGNERAGLVGQILGLAQWFIARLGPFQSLALLSARWYVGKVFFISAWVSLHDWSGTLSLYEDDFHVPVLPPHVAAYLGTGGELVLPVLLFAGLATRFGAAGLSVVNLVAYLSISDLPPAAVMGHVLWACLLGTVVLWGPGMLSLDHLIARRLQPDPRD